MKKEYIVSACLAGLECKYSGGHNLNPQVKKLVDEGRAVLVCPEELGGLETPREPAEIIGGNGYDVLDGKAKVVDSQGRDITQEFITGSRKTLEVAQSIGAAKAILKESSPSCGGRKIYDGTFTGNKIAGIGVTAALLKRHAIKVISEEDY